MDDGSFRRGERVDELASQTEQAASKIAALIQDLAATSYGGATASQ